MNHEKIDRMKQEYEQIEVPEALKTHEDNWKNTDIRGSPNPFK